MCWLNVILTGYIKCVVVVYFGLRFCSCKQLFPRSTQTLLCYCKCHFMLFWDIIAGYSKFNETCSHSVNTQIWVVRRSLWLSERTVCIQYRLVVFCSCYCLKIMQYHGVRQRVVLVYARS
jgi:hypothetical protein